MDISQEYANLKKLQQEAKTNKIRAQEKKKLLKQQKQELEESIRQAGVEPDLPKIKETISGLKQDLDESIPKIKAELESAIKNMDAVFDKSKEDDWLNGQ